jgi:hypothetical protein
MIKPVGFVVAIAGLLGASEAKAQHIFHRGGAHRGVATTVHGGTIAGRSSAIYSSGAHAAATGHGGTGYNDFPFYGAPYGRPYAPWTWPYMSGSYGQGLARYYDPPVK